MKLLSVNVGRASSLDVNGHPVTTGIHKVPQGGPVRVGTLGLEDDFIGSEKHHGGPDQAVYLYSQSDYDWWQSETGRTFSPGAFGENLTLDDWWGKVHVGDQIQLGDVVLEMTAPRIPCGTFQAFLREQSWVKRFNAALRAGVYARVIRDGVVEAGGPVSVVRTCPQFPIVSEIHAFYVADAKNDEFVLRALEAPIAERTRRHFEKLVHRSG